MRITSPKNIKITNQDYAGISKPYFTNNLQGQLGLRSRESFYSRKQSEHSSRLTEEYGMGQKVSTVTESLQSNRSNKSLSKYQGISTSRNRAIRMDNIYQAEHFPVMTIEENKSSKSITLSTNRNIKSISRVTRTTSPTITSYPLKGNHQLSTWANTSINGSVRQINPPPIATNKSIQNDLFDFRDLRKQINKNTQQKTIDTDNILLPQQNEDYYGLNNVGRFNNNKKFQPILNSSTNISNTNSKKSFNHLQVQVQNQNTLTYHNQSPTQSGLMSPRTKSPSQFFGVSLQISKSTKMITVEKDLPIKKMSPNMQSNRRLGWKDVVKK